MTPIPKAENNTTNTILWALQVLVALAFLAAGFSKLSGQPAMVAAFAKLGAGQWFRYITGGIEIVSSVLLVIPKSIPVGALLLVCTMIGAVAAHLLVLGGTPIPPAVLLVLTAIIAWGRRDRLKALL